MRSPRSSGVRIPSLVRERVKKRLNAIEAQLKFPGTLVLDQVRYELGLMDPKQAEQHAAIEQFAAVARAWTEKRRDMAAARRMLTATVPTLNRMRACFEDAPLPFGPETIRDLLETEEKEWVETARVAKLIEAALNTRRPFAWNVDSARELLAAKSATIWMEAQLAQRVGISRAKFHDIAYRQPEPHRMAT